IQLNHMVNRRIIFPWHSANITEEENSTSCFRTVGLQYVCGHHTGKQTLSATGTGNPGSKSGIRKNMSFRIIIAEEKCLPGQSRIRTGHGQWKLNRDLLLTFTDVHDVQQELTI